MAEALNSRIRLIPAGVEQKPVLANLLELYSHDFCDFLELQLGADGRFGYRQLDLYWTEPARHPLLVKIDEKLAGFVFVRKMEAVGNEAAWDMAEFFILRGLRRQGFGMDVAHQVFLRFPGRWQVRVRVANQEAHRFWEHTIAMLVGHAAESALVRLDDNDWHIFSFRLPPAA